MSRPARHDAPPSLPSQPPAALPDEALVYGEGGGMRTLYYKAASMQQLLEGLTVMLSEHATDDDELYISYSSMQSGWQEHAMPAAGFRAASSWTQIFFEYSALVVLRPAR